MGNKESFSLTDEETSRAEQRRVAGELKEVVSITGRVMDFDLDSFSELGVEDQTRFLQALRIYAVAHISGTKYELLAPRAAGTLGVARQSIVRNYRHPSGTFVGGRD